MSQAPLRILVVEDDAAVAEAIRRVLAPLGHARIELAEHLARAREIVAAEPPRLVIAELVLPDGLGTDLFEERAPRFPLIALVGPESRRLSGHALKAGAVDCLVKSAESLAALPRIARSALRAWDHALHRHRAESQADMLQRMAEAGGYGFALASLDGPLAHVNPSFCGILGYASEAELVGRPFAALFPKPEAAALEQRVLPRVREQGQWVGEINMLSRGGALTPTFQNIFVVEHPASGTPMLASLAIKVFGRKLAEDALETSERKLRTLFENMIAGFAYHRIVTDAKGRPTDYVFLEANSAFEEMTGLKREEIIGRRVTEALPGIEDDPFDWIGTYGKVALTGEPVCFEQFSELLGMWFAVSAYSPEPRHFAVTIENITERKRSEEELALHRERLEQIVEERTASLRAAQDNLLRSERLATLGRLTATVSHELRNPLGTIRTSLYSVRTRLADAHPSILRSIARAERSIERCDRIIDELLDFARVHAPRPEATAMDAWASEVLEEARPPEGVRLASQIAAGVTLRIDREHLRRCVVNLLDNAFQALKESGRADPEVALATRVAGDRFEIVVADNGPGIPQERLDRIFEPLYSSRSFGLGLGLAIVKRIMQTQGGDVEVQSAPGQGATFTLWLPM